MQIYIPDNDIIQLSVTQNNVLLLVTNILLCMQIYIPDDDIIQLPATINRAFDIQEVYGLELAQPTLCSRIESETVHGVGLYKEGPTVLRYVTFVEIMVPMFSMEFFKGHVVDTLATSASGKCLMCCM